MADASVINLDDAPVIARKRGRSHPRGSKNKPKTSASTSSATVPTKRRRGRPLGSKNKKSFTTTVGSADLPDVSLVQPILPQSSAENLFSFFATRCSCDDAMQAQSKH
jgi:hypothetical protein